MAEQYSFIVKAFLSRSRKSHLLCRARCVRGGEYGHRPKPSTVQGMCKTFRQVSDVLRRRLEYMYSWVVEEYICRHKRSELSRGPGHRDRTIECNGVQLVSKMQPQVERHT